MNKKELLVGSLLNLTFILIVVGTRFYYAKQEMDFLRSDSERQDVLIEELRDSVSVLKEQNEDIITDLHDHNKSRGVENAKLKEDMKVFQEELDTIKVRLSQKVSILDKSYGSGVVPFEKEFGRQNDYLRIFGRTGIAIENDSIVDAETNLGFDGSLEQGKPFIEQGEVKGEWFAVVPEKQFEGVLMNSRRSNAFKIKPPKNQISIGPFVGITYDQTTGLTEPVIGFGVTYNAFKIWDWR